MNRGRGNAYFRGRGGGFYARRKPQKKDKDEIPVQKRLEDYAIPSPFKGWNLYFPDECYSKENKKAKHVEIISMFLLKTINIAQRKTEIESRGSFILDVKDLSGDAEITSKWPSFNDDLRDSPEIVLLTCGLAMHDLLTKEMEKEWESDMAEGDAAVETMPSVPFVFARLVGFEPLLPLKNLKANCFGKLVSVKGTVVRASNTNPMCVKMAYKCASCEEIQVTPFTNGICAMPTTCSSDDCKGRIFTPEFTHRSTKIIDWQTIKIQELSVDDKKESARIPRTIECEVTNDLVDSCVPGDVVIVNGIVKTMSDVEIGRKKDQQCTYTLYIDAVSMTNCKGSKNRTRQELTNHIGQELTIRDLYAVEKMQSEKDLFKLIVASLSPSIYGHEIVKAGLVLALFGGTAEFVDDKNRIPVRGDVHVLVVGDPGLGKSQLLQACANVAPRSVYVCGNTSTSSGLTVTICKGSAGADYALEAGALVLADQGCCCIDEFDKMTTQHQALLEAMEQQSISIAKAGIICSLPARASILAAANPIGGHYNKSKSVAENIKLGSALLSRFDLVFILLDKPDKDWDSLLSNHIMSMHSGGPNNLNNSFLPAKSSNDTKDRHFRSLLNKLRYENGEVIDRIPHQLLRKYIGYARTYVRCKLAPEASKILQDFYLTLRSKSRNTDSTPITTRQLESLVRLAEARAKVELRQVVTEEDAKDVVEIMKCSMMDAFSNDNSVLDLQPSELLSSGTSGRAKKNKKFIAELDKIAGRTGNPLFTVEQMRIVAQGLKIDLRTFENLIDTLNNQNYLLKKGPKTYKLQTF